MKYFVSVLAFFVFFTSEVCAQTKIARAKQDGSGYEFVIEPRVLRKVFVNLFSTDGIQIDPTNIAIKESTGKIDLQGVVFLVAESRMGEEGQGSKVMRVYLMTADDGYLYLPVHVIGEECANVDCTRCAFDDDAGCFCGLRTEENTHVVGCRHLIFAGENQRK
ncbi:MAG: hypothetical protein K1X92_15430 [Bacteroidia bacterium]|nr:hypothetical protein [Bacteroidia bacterium]